MRERRYGRLLTNAAADIILKHIKGALQQAAAFCIDSCSLVKTVTLPSDGFSLETRDERKMEKDKLFEVGRYIDDFNVLTGAELPCGPIYQSRGLIKHTQRRHPEQISRVYDIPAVIQAPDFIGTHPKEPDSVELVKRMDGNVMVCVKLDRKNDYLYVATVFEITEAKLQNRLNSGRLKRR